MEDAVEVFVGLDDVVDFLVVVMMLSWDVDLVDEMVFFMLLVGGDETGFLVVEVV